MDEATILEDQVKYHRELYYNKQPEITDQEFDKLIDRLKEIKPDSLLLKQVGVLPKKHKISLPFILGSLDKTGPQDALKWMRKQNDSILISDKVDGVSFFARWKNGKLKMLTTRGDGKIGEDILYKAKKIKKLPYYVKDRGVISSRGEMVIIGKLPSGYKTKRNACAGIINRDDLQNAESITAIFHELIEHKKLPRTESGRFKLMNTIGMKTVNHKLFKKDDITREGGEIISWMTSRLKTKGKSIEMDGLILTVNTSDRENVEIPKNKIAFKIPDLPQETKVTGIEWSVTRTGRVVPVVHVDIIEKNGVEIEHPTGHNYFWVKERKIDKGATITVIRSGDVIPYITGVVRPALKFSAPTKCPSCNSPLRRESVDLTCTSGSCHAQALGQIEYFIRILGAENISIPTLEKLNLKYIEDFYELKKNKIAKVDGLGDISADNIIVEMKKTLITTEDKLLAAFGIPLVGLKNARKIVDALELKGKFGNVFNMGPMILYSKVSEIGGGIGHAVAQSLKENIFEYDNLYKFLRAKGLKFVKEKTTKKLNGMAFQFTGKMNKERSDLERSVLNNGGRIASVSKKLNYLVIADKNSTSTKARKARELGVKMINEKQFLKMVGE